MTQYKPIMLSPSQTLKKKKKSFLNLETNNHISIQIPNLNTQKLIYDPQHKRGSNKIKKEKK